MKHPATAETEVEVVEVEEELNNSGSNDVEVCSDVNLNQDFVEQAADDPGEVDQCEVENQGNGSSGFSYERAHASNADANNSNGDHDEAVDELAELGGPAQESGHHTEVEN